MAVTLAHTSTLVLMPSTFVSHPSPSVHDSGR
jgi:hypothetical protein